MTAARAELDVITVGDVFVDLVLSGLERWPAPGEEHYARQMARAVGGGCAITAAGLAAQGLRVAAVAALGAQDGAWARAELAGRGVDTRLLLEHPTEPTAVTVSVSRADERYFVTYAGANPALPRWLDDPAALGALTRARHVHLACELPPARLAALARALRRCGTALSVDVGFREAWLRDPAALEALAAVDLFLPNALETEVMTGADEPGAALAALAAAGLRRVAVKRGADGALLLWDGEVLEQAPHPVSPLDTTGAGDCFDAGLIAGLLLGEGPAESLRRGAVCGALSTRALGGMAGFPAAGELAAALAPPPRAARDTGG